MKLTEKLKKEIDNFFENITAEELYRISVEKYGLKENMDIELEDQSFDTVNKSIYSKKNNEIDVGSNNKSLPLAA